MNEPTLDSWTETKEVRKINDGLECIIIVSGGKDE